MSLEAELAAEIAVFRQDGAAPPFEPWALRIFRHQYDRNPPYRTFCDRRGVTPETVVRWEDVPPVPTAAFRGADLACGAAEIVFRTSGTTGGGAARGRHLVPCAALYRASALAAFETFVLPDGLHPRVLALLPGPAVRPDSSLVHMCGWVGEASGAATEWLADADGLDIDRVCTRLADAERTGEAVLLAGPTAAFARLFETCRTTGRRFRLGPPSRLMDTGGAKGMARPLSRGAFFRECYTHLGLASYHCINEYGMTELCSQRYDSVLWDRFQGRSLAPRRLVAPPWLRTRVLDPDTLAPVPAGTDGLLCHHDLANAGSVAVVLTEDIGHTVGDDGIAVLGRTAGAPPRGCGLLLAELAGA
ncbi:MAG: long-chain fatty acid--CoA ligase [Candidatus Binatia bacterium]